MTREICPLTDDEAEATLTAIFRTKGGKLTREGECFLAGMSACHVAEQLALAGLRIARVTSEAAVDPVPSGEFRFTV